MNSLLFDQGVSGQKDRDHYLSDWESNIDGHLMRATDKYLSKEPNDFEGFREYMRMVFKRPFVGDEKIRDWFANLSDRLSGDRDEREEVLRDLASELNV